MDRLKRWLAALFRRQAPAKQFSIAYEGGACQSCGETSAVIDGKCWYCRTGNVPVKEPMTWSPNDF